jgi:hypothetical protein
MSDSTTQLDLIAQSQAQKEVTANAMFDAGWPAMLFARRATTTTALTWGYYGGSIVLAGTRTPIANGTVALTASTTNYVEATTAGSVSKNTSGFTAGRIPLYTVVTNSAGVDSYVDYRDAGIARTGTVGKHELRIMAAEMQPSASGGCAALATIATSANQPDITSLDFDATTEEYAQFAIPFPKRWNLGTVTFRPLWSHAATATNFGVVWSLQAVAISNDDAIAAAYGTAQTSTDTGGTTDDLYIGPESSAITIAGTPAIADVVHFRIYRTPGDGADTLAIDARLHGVVVTFTTAAETDV